MITSEVQIFNLALSQVGIAGTVATVDDVSREAKVCRQWFGPVRDRVLRAAHWPSAKTFARLSLISSREDETWTLTDPEPGYSNIFYLPDDYVAPRYLNTFERFSVSSQGTRIALSCNSESPILVYTKRQESVALWDISMADAVMYALAARICEPLSGRGAKAKELFNLANLAMMSAREDAGNTSNETLDTVPGWIAARGYSGSLGMSRYYYPLESLFSAGDIGG